MIRNFINVTGITPEEELPNKITEQMIQYAEVETLFIPKNSPEIKSIYEIILEVDILSHRIIHSPLGTTMVLDGVKKHKIIYTEKDESEKASILNVNIPFNTFIELPNYNGFIPIVNIYILDAYFDILSERKIYSHTIYLIDVYHDGQKINHTTTDSINRSQTVDEMALSKEFRKTENKTIEYIDLDSEYL